MNVINRVLYGWLAQSKKNHPQMRRFGDIVAILPLAFLA